MTTGEASLDWVSRSLHAEGIESGEQLADRLVWVPPSILASLSSC